MARVCPRWRHQDPAAARAGRRDRPLGQPGGDDLGDGLRVGAADDPLVIEGPFKDDAHSARRVREHGGEDVAAVTPHRAHLDHPGNPGAQLDAVVGRLVGVLEHLDAAHRGVEYVAEKGRLARAGRLAIEIMTWYCPPGTMSKPGRAVTV